MSARPAVTDHGAHGAGNNAAGRHPEPSGAAVSLPRGVTANPRVSQWLAIHGDGTVHVFSGKAELGQGILTALGQIAADELGVAPHRVLVLAATTASGPDQGFTAGSMSVADAEALRMACAEARALFLREAAARLGVDADEMVVADGVLRDRDGTCKTSYWDLAARVDLDREILGLASPRPVAGRAVVGTSAARVDLPDKMTGRPRFIHDLSLPGRLAGRVVRPPSPAARLLGADLAPVERLPGVVAVVRDGDFLGVVAETETGAERAAVALRQACRWREEESLPPEESMQAVLRGAETETTVVRDDGAGPGPAATRGSGAESAAATAPAGTTDTGDPGDITDITDADSDGEAPVATTSMAATYTRGFLAHASIAPSCGAALWDEDGLTVWSHSQGVHPLRRAIAQAAGVDIATVTVHHVEGAGAYGHNGADDAAYDAVLLARAVPGRPVHVVWSRADELTWSPLGSAMVADVAAGLAPDGRLLSWSYDVWSYGHTARPGYAGSPGLLAAAHTERPHLLPPSADPALAGGGGTGRNAVPLYVIPRRSIRAHRALTTPIRTSALRTLGAYLNVFAIESFIDEIAAAAGRDALEYRLAHLTDPRAREVVERAARAAGWPGQSTEDGVALGIGFARYKDRGAYCAVVAEVEAVHDIRVRRLTIAVDVGRVVNPDGVANQIEGGAVQSTSWTLKEQVRFDRTRITSDDWESYPILRFTEVPEVVVEVIDRPDEPSVGSGEAAQGPTAAAIGNAVAAAVGVRVRDLPITAERIVAAMDDWRE
ncbi:xanthine dehydrogenase family protein molybdopterin-binding subunit [Streptosporangium sp. 'caverna']|nr:xanthine dehydrogenase family protein molybdopterin-binding subunit [Streptosporangium sp. 'caverna']